MEPRQMQAFENGDLLLTLEQDDVHVTFASHVEFLEEQAQQKLSDPTSKDLRPKRPYVTTQETWLAKTEEV